MLDWAHHVVLRSVEKGDTDESPALDTLIATGLVRRRDSSEGYDLTDAGRAALKAGRSSRLDRWSSWGLAIGGSILIVSWIVERIVD
jgi:hypothetical protein